MALYLGEQRVKININGVRYTVNPISTTKLVSNNRLVSLDNYILKDSTGLYLVPKESE